jgi:UDP-4-amino-4,6-dideoxy-N-acetyl-beta-L-altrosamine transaminase
MSLTLTSPKAFLPYGRQHISDADVEAVVAVLKSDFLTQGPAIEQFERAVAQATGARQMVACSSGTAALHLAMLALDINPGDIVVTTPNTFVASANCARYVGAEVRFCDINPDTGLIDPANLATVLEKDRHHKIKAVIPVHFAGQPAQLSTIHDLARAHGAYVVDDACHALGAQYTEHRRGHRIGDNSHSDLTAFSFHPVKHVATGEGGAISASDPLLADRVRQLRSHGIARREFQNAEMAVSSRGELNPWYYEMTDLGFNYRMTDIHAALGVSQMNRLAWSVEQRNRIAGKYAQVLSAAFDDRHVRPLDVRDHVSHAYHLYVVRIDFGAFKTTRASVMNRLREQGIGTQVHYIPAHLQPYYRDRYGHRPGDFPGCEAYYAQALSLPMYPDLTDGDVELVVAGLETALLKE